jgi:hypothetical protein
MVTNVFKRYEMKYLLNQKQYEAIKSKVQERLTNDEFGENTIQSLYYDTLDDRLIRLSLEKPIFKEKLRLRCYNLNNDNKDIYVEMKRKYDGIVYKRRIACKENEADNLLKNKTQSSQIGKELNYFTTFYGNLIPKILIIYDRSAYYDKNSCLRITFDKNIRYRKDNLNFHTSLDGENLLPNNLVLMEIKTDAALPLWVCDILDKEHIIKTSFSKYGAAYEHEFYKLKVENKRSNQLCLNQSLVMVPSLQ